MSRCRREMTLQTPTAVEDSTDRYPASRGPSIFLDKSGRGRDLCKPPRLSLICRSSTETDESVRLKPVFPAFAQCACALLEIAD